MKVSLVVRDESEISNLITSQFLVANKISVEWSIPTFYTKILLIETNHLTLSNNLSILWLAQLCLLWKCNQC